MSEEMRTKMFRNALNGYNKSDVAEYIQQMNIDFQTERLKLQTAMADAERAITEKNALEEKEKELLARIEALENECAEAKQRIAVLQNDIDDKEQLVAAQNDALDKICSEVEELKGKCDTVNNTGSETSEKARLYDTMSSQIGDILINANKNAEEILEQAKMKAVQIENDAVNNAKISEEKARNDAKTLSENFLFQIKESYGEYYAVEKSKLEAQKMKYDELLELIDADKTELDTLIEKKQREITEIIQNKSLDLA